MPNSPKSDIPHLPIHDFPVALCNDKWVPQTEAGLPLHDAGFVWGATITDFCRTVGHKLYRWPDHFQRFRQSCKAARIYPPFSEEEIEQCAHDLVAHNTRFLQPQQDLALVVLATPGAIGYYLGESGIGPPSFFMQTFSLPFARYLPHFQEGIRLIIPSTRHVPSVCVDPKIKQRSRMHWWLAEQEVHQTDPGASALLLDLHGHVTETAAANFLLVKSGTIYSPPSHSILGGISLQIVRELCEKDNIPFEERPLTIYDCLNADEAMLTNTAYFLAGVSRINGMKIPWPGVLYRKLLESWSGEIGMDIRGQIESSGEIN